MVIDYNIVHAALEANEADFVASKARMALRNLKIENSEVMGTLYSLYKDSEAKHDALCQHLLSTMPEELQAYLKVTKGYVTTLLSSEGIGHTCWGQNLRTVLNGHHILDFHIRNNKWICDSGATKIPDIPCEVSASHISTSFYTYDFKL